LESTSSELFLQGRRVTRIQVWIIMVCAVVAMVDGFDTQSIALAAPGIAAEFHLEAAAFGPVFGIGLFGGLVGAVASGLAGDRYGRKPVLLLSVTLVAAASFAIVFADTLFSLGAIRFITGLGLGGALPSIIALTSEYAPAERKASVVAGMFCGFPLGAVAGGLASTALIPRFGWQSIFIAGAISPLVLVPLIWATLPESVQFLARREDKQPLDRILRRLGIDPRAAASLAPVPRAEKSPLASLFANGRALGTVLLWVTLLLSLLMTYFLTNWLPILASQNGLPVQMGILGAVMLNLGSIIGSIVLGRIADRRSKWVTITIGYMIGAVAVAAIGQAGQSAAFFLVVTFLAGFFAIGAQLCTVALCASFYTTAVRATGVGAAMGVSRIGGIIGPVLGGLLIAAGFSVPWTFVVIGVITFAAAVALSAMGIFVLRNAGPSSEEAPSGLASQADLPA